MPDYSMSYTGEELDETIANYLNIKTNNNSILTPLSAPGTSGLFLRGDSLWSNVLLGSLVIGDATDNTYTHLDIGRKGTNDVLQNLYIGDSNNGTYSFIQRAINGATVNMVQFFDTYTSFNQSLRINCDTPELLLNNTNAATFSIIRLNTPASSSAGIIFMNGADRADDGGSNLLTIRNNVGDLRLDDNVIITGRTFITIDSDVTPNSSTGSLVIGNTTGLSLGLDANEIMCRSNNTASTLYLLNEGGAVQIGATTTINGGYLKVTANGNTTTIGSLNSSWCHIYNSASIPFIFNNGVLTTGGDLGSATYPWNLLIVKSGGRVWANGGLLCLGNANNASWVTVQDICSHNGAGDSYWSCRVNGTIHYVSLVQNSSITTKKSIKTISKEEGLQLLKLNPITFQYNNLYDNNKENEDIHAGLIAEEVIEILPNIISLPFPKKNSEDENETEGVIGLKYVELIPYLIKLAQIQQQEIDAFKERIILLEQGR